MLGVTLRWTGILFREGGGSKNTPSRFMPQKLVWSSYDYKTPAIKIQTRFILYLTAYEGANSTHAVKAKSG